MIKIGNRKFETNVFLSPLSGVSDLAFRMTAREGGAGMAFFEMISANAVFHRQKKTMMLLKTAEEDKPVACQLLGSSPEIMTSAARAVLAEASPEFIDINAACPVKKVVSNGQGAALLKKPEILFEIVEKMSSDLPVPVTVKLRTGFDTAEINKLIHIAAGCEQAGAATLFVHGRTRKQMYSGEVNYEAIKQVKKSVKIPVIGSGNIFTPPLAEKMFRETGCDGILVARGAFGNPGIFGDIENYFSSGVLPRQKKQGEKIKLLKRHLSYIEKYSEKQPRGKTGFMKKTALWYLKGFDNSASARAEVSRAQTYGEILRIIDKTLKKKQE